MAGTSGARVDRLLYFSSRYTAQVGQSLYLAALLIAAGSGPSVALGLSGVMAGTMVAAMAFGFAGGAVADRIGPGRGYALGAALRLVAILGGIALIDRGGLAWSIAFAYSAGSQIFSPAELAMVPLVSRNSLARVHALLVGLQYAGQGTGALLIPLLFWLGGPSLVMTGAAVAYMVVLSVTGVLAWRVRHREMPHRAPAAHPFSLRETMGFLAGEPRATYAVGLLAFMDMATKCTLVALPVYLVGDLGLGSAGMVLVAVPGVCGVAAGLYWAGRRFTIHVAPRMMRLTLAGTVVSAVALAAIDRGLGVASPVTGPLAGVPTPVSPGVLLALPVALLLGICISLAPIGARAVLSETAPRGQQARVFASQATLTEFAVLVPLLLAGVGTEFAGPRTTFGFVALVGIGLFFVLETAFLARWAPPGKPSAVLAE